MTIIIIFTFASCANLPEAGGSEKGTSGGEAGNVQEAAAALKDFAARTGAGDPNRRVDADVNIFDRLDAAGRYSVRISSYNLKSVFKNGEINGLLIDGIFQIQSDIEELNSLSEIVMYVGPDGENFAIVDGDITELHSDFLFFVACTRVPEKVAEIDPGFIISVEKNTNDGLTEYSIVYDGEGFYGNPELFNLFVISTFREESVKYEVDNMKYIFSFDKDGVPKTSFIRVSINPIDSDGDVKTISSEISIIYNDFQNVKIMRPGF